MQKNHLQIRKKFIQIIMEFLKKILEFLVLKKIQSLYLHRRFTDHKNPIVDERCDNLTPKALMFR